MFSSGYQDYSSTASGMIASGGAISSVPPAYDQVVTEDVADANMKENKQNLIKDGGF